MKNRIVVIFKPFSCRCKAERTCCYIVSAHQPQQIQFHWTDFPCSDTECPHSGGVSQLNVLGCVTSSCDNMSCLSTCWAFYVIVRIQICNFFLTILHMTCSLDKILTAFPRRPVIHTYIQYIINLLYPRLIQHRMDKNEVISVGISWWHWWVLASFNLSAFLVISRVLRRPRRFKTDHSSESLWQTDKTKQRDALTKLSFTPPKI